MCIRDRLLGHAGADAHNVRIGAVPVFPGVDFHMGCGEGQAMVQVHRLPLRPFAVDVNQHQLITGVLV